MKYIIFKHPRSIKTRILSAFLAFLIFGLMFTSLFENLGFDKVKAVTQVSGPNIAMNTNETGIDGWKNWTPSGSNYKYTGGILAQSATMYDYLSDEEIAGSWNTNITKSKSAGYTDPYTTFNTEISNSGGLVSAGTNNITIVLQKFSNWAEPGDDVYIFLEDDSGHHNGWPGSIAKYNKGNDGSEYIYTFNPSSLGFTPTKIKFHNQSSGGTIPASAEGTGFKFTSDTANYGYKENTDVDDGYKTGKKYYIKYNDSRIWEDQENTADPLYSCSYNIPLYFGVFLSGRTDSTNKNEYNNNPSK